MSKRLIPFIVLLLVSSTLAWSQFWKNYTDEQRKTVAESYWLAGKQYQAAGDVAKGKDYMDLAKVIDPQLDPTAIVEQTAPSAAELLAQGRTTEIGAANPVPTLAIDGVFLRFIGAILGGDSSAVANILDGSVYLTGTGQEITRDYAAGALGQLFNTTSLGGMEPGSLYDLSSIVVARAPQAAQDAWGESYTLNVKAAMDLASSVDIWQMQQQFLIHRVNGDWFIFGYGPGLPPLSWKPQSAALVAAAPAPLPAALDAATSSAITDAFTGCVSALLAKNADGALTFMSDSVSFLRLQQSVSKDELKTTLLGYYDNAGFTAMQPDDVLDMASIFVEPADSPVAGVTGPVYALNVTARQDLSDTIAFWSMYQRYYFAMVGGEWKIFAIL